MSTGYEHVFKYLSVILGLLSSCSMLYLPSLRINQKYQQIFNKWLINEIIRMKLYLIKYILEDTSVTAIDKIFAFLDKTLSAYSLLIIILLLCNYIRSNHDDYEESSVNIPGLIYIYVIVNVLLYPYLQDLVPDAYDKVQMFVFVNLVLTVFFVTGMTCCGSKRMDETYLIAGVAAVTWFLYFLEKTLSFNAHLCYIVNLTPLFIIIVMKQLTEYTN